MEPHELARDPERVVRHIAYLRAVLRRVATTAQGIAVGADRAAGATKRT